MKFVNSNNKFKINYFIISDRFVPPAGRRLRPSRSPSGQAIGFVRRIWRNRRFQRIPRFILLQTLRIRSSMGLRCEPVRLPQHGQLSSLLSQRLRKIPRMNTLKEAWLGDCKWICIIVIMCVFSQTISVFQLICQLLNWRWWNICINIFISEILF